MQTQPGTMPLSLQALEVLNESPDHVYALTHNPRNGKWTMLQMQRTRITVLVADEQTVVPAQFAVTSFTAGNTPEDAARDALRLKLAPERTVASGY